MLYLVLNKLKVPSLLWLATKMISLVCEHLGAACGWNLQPVAKPSLNPMLLKESSLDIFLTLCWIFFGMMWLLIRSSLLHMCVLMKDSMTCLVRVFPQMSSIFSNLKMASALSFQWIHLILTARISSFIDLHLLLPFLGPYLSPVISLIVDLTFRMILCCTDPMLGPLHLPQVLLSYIRLWILLWRKLEAHILLRSMILLYSLLLMSRLSSKNVRSREPRSQ